MNGNNEMISKTSSYSKTYSMFVKFLLSQNQHGTQNISVHSSRF